MTKNRIIESTSGYTSKRESEFREEYGHMGWSNSEVFFRHHTEVLMMVRELQAFMRLGDSSASILAEITPLINELKEQIRSLAINEEEGFSALAYAAERVESSIIDLEISDRQKLQLSKELFRLFDFQKNEIKEIQQVLSEEKLRETESKEYLASHAELQSKIDDLISQVELQSDSNLLSIREEEGGFTALPDKIHEIRIEINEDPDLETDEEVEAVFSQVAKQINTAFGVDPLVVASISDDFQLIDRIGQGAQGAAYEAVDKDGSRLVVKILSPQSSKEGDTPISRDDAAMFQKELDTLRDLDHPNIVEFIRGEMIATGKSDANGDAEYTGWIAMERIYGKDLEAQRKERDLLGDPYSTEEILRIAESIAQAFLALNAKGLMHRDVKGQNIMVNHREVKLIDFGVTVSAEELSNGETNPIAGTPLYMSPEASIGLPEEKSDIFSLGVVLYILINNEHPYLSKSDINLYKAGKLTPASIAAAVSADPLNPFKTKDCPIILQDFIKALLTRDPEQRLSAQEVLDQVQTIRTELSREALAAQFSTEEDYPETDFGIETVGMELFDTEKMKEISQAIEKRIDDQSFKEEFTVAEFRDALKEDGVSSTENQVRAILNRLLAQDVLSKGRGEFYIDRYARNLAQLRGAYHELNEENQRYVESILERGEFALITREGGEDDRVFSSGFPGQYFGQEQPYQPPFYDEYSEGEEATEDRSKIGEVMNIRIAKQTSKPKYGFVSGLMSLFSRPKPGSEINAQKLGFSQSQPMYEIRFDLVDDSALKARKSTQKSVTGFVLYLPQASAGNFYELLREKPKLARTMLMRFVEKRFKPREVYLPDFTLLDDDNKQIEQRSGDPSMSYYAQIEDFVALSDQRNFNALMIKNELVASGFAVTDDQVQELLAELVNNKILEKGSRNFYRKPLDQVE